MGTRREDLLCELEDIEKELAYLTDIIDNDKLYEINLVLYHRPSEVPGMEEQLQAQQSLTPKLKAYLQRHFASRFHHEEKRKRKFLKKYDGWHKHVSSLEINDPPEFHTHTSVERHTTTISTPNLSLASMTMPSGRGSRRGASGDAVRSEAELNQILLSLLEQERDNPATRWMATLAVTPPMLHADPKYITEHHYEDTNGQLPQTYFQVQHAREAPPPCFGESVVSYNGSVVWTEAEQKIFIDKFIAYHKNFRKIASFLPFKRTADCVAFYYRNKKRLRLKQLRKNMMNDGSFGGRMRAIKKSVGGPGRPPKKAKRPGRPPRNATAASSTGDEMEDMAASLLSMSQMMNPDSVLPDADDE